MTRKKGNEPGVRGQEAFSGESTRIYNMPPGGEKPIRCNHSSGYICKVGSKTGFNYIELDSSVLVDADLSATYLKKNKTKNLV